MLSDAAPHNYPLCTAAMQKGHGCAYWLNAPAGAVRHAESVCTLPGLHRPRLSATDRASMKISLTAKIGLTIVSIVAFVLLLVTFLNYFKFQKTLTGLLDSRVRVVSLDLKSTVESGLNLGLALEDIDSLQPILDHAREINPLIATIRVFDDAGKAVFSSPADGMAAIPATWREALERSESDTFSLAEENEFIVGAPLVNNLDKAVGGITVTYSRGYFDGKVAAMLRELGEAAIYALAIFGSLSIVAVILLLREVSAAYRRMQAAMSLAAGDHPPDEGGTAKTELETHMLAVRDYAAGAKREIDAAADHIETLGRKEGSAT